MPTGEAASPACPVCHQPVSPNWYFCPNCGANLHPAPLSTSAGAQAALYLFSIVLPMLCFLFVTRWPGPAYFRSQDPKEKQIGTIAIALITLSTILTIYFAYVWTMDAINSSVNEVNAELGM